MKYANIYEDSNNKQIIPLMGKKRLRENRCVFVDTYV